MNARVQRLQRFQTRKLLSIDVFFASWSSLFKPFQVVGIYGFPNLFWASVCYVGTVSQFSEFPPKESVIDHVLQSAFADLEQWIPRTKQWITRTTPDPKIKVSTVDPDEAGLSRRISTSRNMSVSWNLHSNYQQYIEGLSV